MGRLLVDGYGDNPADTETDGNIMDAEEEGTVTTEERAMGVNVLAGIAIVVSTEHPLRLTARNTNHRMSGL